MKSIAIGSDPNAAGLKAELKRYLAALGYECEDYGSSDPIYANTAIRGAYAALVTDPYSAERAKKSNNANIICFGAQTIGLEVAKSLLSIWLASEYSPGEPSEPKIARIHDYERSHGG